MSVIRDLFGQGKVQRKEKEGDKVIWVCWKNLMSFLCYLFFFSPLIEMKRRYDSMLFGGKSGMDQGKHRGCFYRRTYYFSTVALCRIGSSLSVRLRTICLISSTDGFSIANLLIRVCRTVF